MDRESYKKQNACRDCKSVKFDEAAKMWYCQEEKGEPSILVSPVGCCNNFQLP